MGGKSAGWRIFKLQISCFLFNFFFLFIQDRYVLELKEHSSYNSY